MLMKNVCRWFSLKKKNNVLFCFCLYREMYLKWDVTVIVGGQLFYFIIIVIIIIGFMNEYDYLTVLSVL